ncbi:MAG: glycosyltransferase family 10, partial [bacterium]|nr:glycosyltransferase family 10 [bacterium]
EAINFFDKYYDEEFYLYGKGWNKPRKYSIYDKIFKVHRFKVYKGEIPIDQKFKVLSESKYCLCYENAFAPGYITEKVFDCFIAGCVPIYLGATDISSILPKESYIDFKEFRNYEDLYLFLKSITKEDYQNYVEKGYQFITSTKASELYYRDSFINFFQGEICKL